MWYELQIKSEDFSLHAIRKARQWLTVSEFLQPTDNMEILFGFRICPENGIMEWWNAGPPQADQKDISHFNFIVNPIGGGTINPILHYPRTHYSSIPSFQL
jgi:hypothetical protein